MATVCENITEWIETHVSKPIEDWENSQEKRCKKRHWYDPRSWFCWLVTILVKVIRWVVVTVVTVGITMSCRFFRDLLGNLWDWLKGLGLLLKALVTWDKCTLQEGLGELFNGIILNPMFPFFGDWVFRPIIDRIQTYRLRNYVKRQIAQRFSTQPDLIPVLEGLFNVNSGVFGYRLTCTVYRMFVDSQRKTGRFGDMPDLYGLHDGGLINLYQLAGFDQDCSIFDKKGWYRPRHQTATYPPIVAGGGGGFGEPTPPEMSRDELKEYIESVGTRGPHFRIYAISPGNLGTRIDVAAEKGRQLGLILSFDRKEIEVTDEHLINYSPEDHVPDDPMLGPNVTTTRQRRFLINGTESNGKLINGIGRNHKRIDAAGAQSDLCQPIAVAVFGFKDKEARGLTENLIGTTSCKPGRNLDASTTSGATFIDDIPDELRKYVLVHELGHYFGLCHADGFDRIMVSGKPGQGDALTWGALPNFLLHGGPRFIHAEAQSVWDFILTNFPIGCFVTADTPPVIF